MSSVSRPAPSLATLPRQDRADCPTMLTSRLAYSSAPTSPPSRPETERPAAAKPAAAPESQAGAPQPAQEEKLSRQATQDMVKELNKAIQQINTSLEFSQDEETGWTVVKIIDRETKETIRQFPSEEAIAIAHSLDRTKSLLLRQTA